MRYVKNITAHYRQLLDEILTGRPDLAHASSGYTQHFFVPDPDKTFHRSSTDYFVNGRQQSIGVFDSPKFIGLPVGEILSIGKQELNLKGNAQPMQLLHGDETITLKFDCKACEMHVMGTIKPHILNKPRSGSIAGGRQTTCSNQEDSYTK